MNNPNRSSIGKKGHRISGRNLRNSSLLFGKVKAKRNAKAGVAFRIIKEPEQALEKLNALAAEGLKAKPRVLRNRSGQVTIVPGSVLDAVVIQSALAGLVRPQRLSKGDVWPGIRSHTVLRKPPVEPSIPEKAYEPSAKAEARLRGLQILEQDLRAADGTYDLQQVMGLLKITRQAVADRVKDDSLLAVPGPSNQRRYPAFQFTDMGVPRELRAILKALPSNNPWFRLHWLVNPDARLDGRKPIELLKEGKSERVIEAARQTSEMGS